MDTTVKDKLELLGTYLKSKFDTYAFERTTLELQWLRNLRQYKSIYDPEVKIPANMSRVYPKDTHTKIVGWVAKVMEMMFPAQEKNWSITPTPFPNIAEKDLQNIINGLQTTAAAQGVGEITPEMIEDAVKVFATQRAERMTLECADQLADSNIDYPELCKKSIRRGGIYGFGVVEGPQVRTQLERVWEIDKKTDQFVAVEKKIRKPFYTNLKAWDVYPDLSAQTWDAQEGLFVRKAVSRQGLRALAKRDDFLADVINEYLKEHTRGNYKAKSFEAELNTIKQVTQNATSAEVRQYEILRWYGYLPADQLVGVGVSVPSQALSKDILADVWILDGVVIKADTAPFGERVSDMFHAFIPEEDEDSALTGTAKVETLRDSQLKLCAIDRAIMDNMADSASSIKEVNDDLLDSSKRVEKISGGMTIHRTGEGNEANYPAIRIYDIPNHTSQLLALRNNFVKIFDSESHLQAWMLGDTQPLGEAFRTSNNMSMMRAGGDMVTKDDVRSFDRFVKSVIGSLVKWNMQFNEKDDIKGDFQVMPKGSLSLVAKEVRGATLDQLTSTLTPRERTQIDERKLLEDRFLSRDLPADYLLPKKEAEARLQQYDQSQAQAAQVQQGLDESKTQFQLAAAQEKAAKAEEIAQTVATKVQKGLSEIANNMAKVKGAKDATALQSIKLLLDQVTTEAAREGAGSKPERQTTSK